MNTSEIVTIIVAICGMAAAIIPAVLNRRTQNKIKPRKAVNAIPEPFACSSIYHEGICSFTYTERDGYKFKYNFEHFSSDERNIGFVSLVYRFSQSTSLVKCKSLSFQLIFSDPGHFNQVDVEIKSELGMKVFPFQRGVIDTNRIIDLRRDVKKEILSQVTQICFVVKPDYHIESMPWDGEFTVNNLSLN